EGLREELGINPGDLVVGMVSCFKPQKSPQDFIRLAFLIKRSVSQGNLIKNILVAREENVNHGSIKFILIGDGVLRKTIEAMIVKLDLKEQVILTGWREDIPRILSTIDAFVLTSLWEGLPISVLEAMAASLPVLVSDTGGVKEVVAEGKTGFLVAPGDTRMTAEKLTRLLKDKRLREQIGKDAQDSLGPDFSLGNMAINTENSYRDLIKRQYAD
ncbi:MAG: glycosyltransferase, partial [Candidatus Omnitrophota bacterium]